MGGQNTVTVFLPSNLGSEKVAMDRAGDVAREMGFSEDRIRDVKTAVAEACLNAIEHGNRFNESISVGVTMVSSDSSLSVSVSDAGTGPGEVAPPDLDMKMTGKEEARGWGIFLIRSLVDEVEFLSSETGGNTVRMVIHLEK